MVFCESCVVVTPGLYLTCYLHICQEVLRTSSEDTNYMKYTYGLHEDLVKPELNESQLAGAVMPEATIHDVAAEQTHRNTAKFIHQLSTCLLECGRHTANFNPPQSALVTADERFSIPATLTTSLTHEFEDMKRP